MSLRKEQYCTDINTAWVQRLATCGLTGVDVLVSDKNLITHVDYEVTNKNFMNFVIYRFNPNGMPICVSSAWTFGNYCHNQDAMVRT
jgi:hypothetical protein